MRVVVVGANGQLGTDVCAAYRASGHVVIEVTHGELDIRDAAAVERTLGQAAPAVVVNTAAMHHMDACEADPGLAADVNAGGARNLAAAGHRLGFTLLHVSTDYVFDGAKGAPYVETDEARPLNVYGRTKLDGERLVQETLRQHFVVRTSGLYGHTPCRAKPTGNFVQLMLRLGRERGEVRVVTDEVVTPTFTEDLARQLVRLTDSEDYGLYHATPQGQASWFEFAQAIFELAGAPVHVLPASASEFPAKTPRPKFSVLDNLALRRRAMDILPHWKESLGRYVRSLKQ